MIEVALCVNNDEMRASLKIGKIYQLVDDNNKIVSSSMIRIIDEEQEAYYHSAQRFEIIGISEEAYAKIFKNNILKDEEWISIGRSI